MRRILASTALCAAIFSGSANAENFNGPYAGLQAGYSWGTFKESGSLTDGVDTISGKEKTSPSGFEGGLFAGYRSVVFDKVVLGGELGYLRSGADKRNADWFELTPLVGNAIESEIEKKDEFSISVKPGLLLTPESLIYGIVGVQWAKGKQTLIDTATGERDSDTERFRGFHIGAGAEVVTVNNVSLRLEYKYQDYRSKSYSYSEAGVTGNWKGSMDESVLRVGLSYNF